MASRSTLAVLLVVVLLAGCSGLVGDDPMGDSPDAPEEFEYPAGFSADGITDGEQAVDSYSAAIQNQENYTSEQQYLIDREDEETVVDVTYEVDFDAETANQRSTFETPDGDGFLEFYYADGERFVRSGANGEESGVSVQEWEFSADNMTSVEGVEPLLQNVSSYETTLEERNGETVVRFETTDLQEAEGFFNVDADDEVTEFDAMFVLDSEGAIHEAEYEVSILNDDETQTVSVTFEAMDLGETSVERPEWTDDA